MKPILMGNFVNTLTYLETSGPSLRRAEWNSAIRQIKNLRYFFGGRSPLIRRRNYGMTYSLCLSLLLLPAFAGEPARETTSLDANWKFTLGDPAHAVEPSFPDAGWRTLNLPHDWSIEGAFDEQNPAGGAGAFLPAGIGWYRKGFTLPASAAHRRVSVEFDGVMANSDVWVNGFHLGKRPNGYVSFGYELTGHLEFGPGKTNRLAVRADNAGQPASRWYAGAGIYRHVRLVLTEPVHFERGGTFITTPKVSVEQSVVRIQTTVANQSDVPREVSVQASIRSPNNQSALNAEAKPRTIEPGKSAEFELELTLNRPQLWDLENPALYQAVTTVRSAAVTLDEEQTAFGIREAKFQADTGFWLNEKNLKIKGVCLHHDAGGLGAAVPLGVWERRLEARERGIPVGTALFLKKRPVYRSVAMIAPSDSRSTVTGQYPINPFVESPRTCKISLAGNNLIVPSSRV